MYCKENYIVSRVYGQSMFPTLKHNDEIFIKKTPVSKIKRRDIILYKNNYYTVSHRVTNIKNTMNGLIFYTKGDFNRIIDKITEDKVLGKIVGIYRKGKLKFLSFENSLIYYIIIEIISLAKELLMKIIEQIYALTFIRKTIKLLFHLKAEYFLIDDIEQNNDFKSFYNFCPFLFDKYIPSFGILAVYKNNPIGKLWILNDEKGNYFLYGPYVKALYRARNIGSGLIKKALDFLKSKELKNYVYAIIFYNRPLIACFKNLDFVLLGEVKEKFYLFKKNL